jgi:hypothetical protein
MWQIDLYPTDSEILRCYLRLCKPLCFFILHVLQNNLCLLGNYRRQQYYEVKLDMAEK